MLYDIYENGLRIAEHLLPEVAAGMLGVSEEELAEGCVGALEVRRANRKQDADGYYVADPRLELRTRRPKE